MVKCLYPTSYWIGHSSEAKETCPGFDVGFGVADGLGSVVCFTDVCMVVGSAGDLCCVLVLTCLRDSVWNSSGADLVLGSASWMCFSAGHFGLGSSFFGPCSGMCLSFGFSGSGFGGCCGFPGGLSGFGAGAGGSGTGAVTGAGGGVAGSGGGAGAGMSIMTGGTGIGGTGISIGPPGAGSSGGGGLGGFGLPGGD